MSIGIVFSVGGDPVPEGDLSYSPKSNRLYQKNQAVLHPWRQKIQWAAKAARARVIDGPVFVTLVFYIKRPKKHFLKAGLRPDAPVYCANHPDVDKLQRAVLDALTGVCYNDDKQVVAVQATKYYADVETGPGVMVTVKSLDAPGKERVEKDASKDELVPSGH